MQSDLQPVTGVGGEERTAEHQDAAQNTFLGHLEQEDREVSESRNNPSVDRGGEKSPPQKSERVRRRALIHHPASSGSATGEARSFAIRSPGPAVPPSATPLSEGTWRRAKEGCLNEKIYIYNLKSGAARGEWDRSSQAPRVLSPSVAW